jgi:hypothetical protein
LLEKFFNNDIKAASSRNPKKANSFRKLCERQDLLVHSGTLSEMVRVAAQEKLLLDAEIDSKKLSYTHKAELIKLPKDSQKIDLAKKAIEENLSTREMADLVKEAKIKVPDEKAASFYQDAKNYLKKI